MTADDAVIASAEDELETLRARVAELSRAEGYARGKLDRLQRIAEKLPIAFYLFDPVEQKNVYANHQLAHLLGISREQIQALGADLFPKILHPDDRGEKIPAHHEELFRSRDGEVFEVTYQVRRADGSYGWVLSRDTIFERAEDGSPTQLLGALVDVSSRVEAEAELKKLLEEKQRNADELHLFKTMVENALDGISVVDENETFVYTNPAFARMCGHERSMEGLSVREVFDPDEFERVHDEVETQLRTRGSFQGRLRHRRKDGSPWMAQISLFVIDGLSARGTCNAAIVRDVTEQLRADEEKAALQARVIEAQQAALSEVSTPLIPIADEVLAMPLVGVLDSARAKQMIEVLLEGIAERRAAVVILDITGIKVVDTYVARALVQAAQAARLLGAEVVLTGIGPELAQTLAMLDVDLQGILVRGSFQSGIAYAMKGKWAALGRR